MRSVLIVLGIGCNVLVCRFHNPPLDDFFTPQLLEDLWNASCSNNVYLRVWQVGKPFRNVP